jgi:hypothetical protein
METFSCTRLFETKNFLFKNFELKGIVNDFYIKPTRKMFLKLFIVAL